MKIVIASLALFLMAGSISHAASCKSYRTCAEVVHAWCSGAIPAADRDRDGIPCEKLCKSLQQVESEKKKAGLTSCPR